MTIQSKTVDYDHDGKTFEGYFTWDDAVERPSPCILVAHAWGGLSEYEQTNARNLAELGYSAFCVDLYGKGVRGSSPEENAALMQPFLDDGAMLQSRLIKASKVASMQVNVDASKMAAIGYCFGGLSVLDMARVGASVLGVVSFHGLFFPPGNTEGNKIQPKVLALHGWDDPMATPDQVVSFAAEMNAAGADWQIHGYGHTYHAFTNPQANDPDNGYSYSESAYRRSWQAMTNFLEELF